MTASGTSLTTLSASTQSVLRRTAEARGHVVRRVAAAGIDPHETVIQVGPPFAEHLRTLLGVLGAGTGPVHSGGWKFAVRGRSRAIAPSLSSRPRLASKRTA